MTPPSKPFRLRTVGAVESTLKEWCTRRVFFEPLYGNNGDTLIRMGSEHALRVAGMQLVDKPGAADLIMLNGGGNINEMRPTGPPELKHYNQTYPDIPLIVLPSSYFFPGREDDFAAIFAGRSAPAHLFAREPYSLERLEKLRFPSEIEVMHDHDMAFHLLSSPWFEHLQKTVASRHILIVERGDAERSTSRPRDRAMGPGIKRMIPTAWKRPVKRWLHARQLRRTPFATQSLDRVFADRPDLKGLPVVAGDISAASIFTFGDFTDAIARAAAVVTTRLHVGILAAMMNKTTYLKFGCDEYRKIRGIYEYSLSHCDDVHIL